MSDHKCNYCLASWIGSAETHFSDDIGDRCPCRPSGCRCKTRDECTCESRSDAAGLFIVCADVGEFSNHLFWMVAGSLDKETAEALAARLNTLVSTLRAAEEAVEDTSSWWSLADWYEECSAEFGDAISAGMRELLEADRALKDMDYRWPLSHIGDNRLSYAVVEVDRLQDEP